MGKNILYFQDESSLDATLISTTFFNSEGKKMHVLLQKGTSSIIRTLSKKGDKILKTPVIEKINDSIICLYCIEIIKDEDEMHEGEEGDIIGRSFKTGRKFDKKEILLFVNESCNSSFDDMIVLNELSNYESVRYIPEGDIVRYCPMEKYIHDEELINRRMLKRKEILKLCPDARVFVENGKLKARVVLPEEHKELRNRGYKMEGRGSDYYILEV